MRRGAARIRSIANADRRGVVDQANEASEAALLIFLGVDYGPPALRQSTKCTLPTGLPLVLGASAYAAIHRRLLLGGIFQLVTPASGLRYPASHVVCQGGYSAPAHVLRLLWLRSS